MFIKSFIIPALITALSISSVQAAFEYRKPNLYNYNITSNQSGQFSYNYIEAGIAENSLKGLGKNYSVAGSYDIGPQINLLGSYTRTTVHHADNSLNNLVLGLGYHIPVAQDTDATANVHYIDSENSITTGNVTTSTSDSGFGINLGVRHMFSPVFEGDANLIYDYVDNSDTTLIIGGRYHYNHQLSLGAGFTINKDDDELGGTVRWSF